MSYTGRFAPSPTGPLHAGSLVTALASWLDARAHGGRWLVRIEDIDLPRSVSGAAELILGQLAACGLEADEAPLRQSQRDAHYSAALERLIGLGWVYPCGCSRRDVVEAARRHGRPPQRDGEVVYAGTCRDGLHDKPARAARVLAAASPDAPDSALVIDWTDRRLGAQRDDVSQQVGDFVVHRADGLWAYQLAVVVDDADQRISDVVRGEDLADNTARQIHLQRLLGLPRPRYLHTPLVRAANGAKLSKQNSAAPLDTSRPLELLKTAGALLDVHADAEGIGEWLAQATAQWRARWVDAAARDSASVNAHSARVDAHSARASG